MSFNYYVWYRVERDDTDTETAIRSMMARLACQTGVNGRLMKKRGEERLWMEVYEDVADCPSFETRLAQVADQYDVEMFIADGRRMECFGDDPPIAPGCARHV